MDSPKTFLTGLLGEHIAASRSPEIHQNEAIALGQVLVYRMIDFERLQLGEGDIESILRAAEYFGFDGLNITFPFKQKIISYLNELSVEATTIGSVNTILFRAGRRIGHNTDWFGFSENFKSGLKNVSIKKVTQIGAGGAGAAVAYALLRLGVQQLFIVDIDYQKAEALALRMQANFPASSLTAGADVATIIPASDGVVQTTPVGMVSHPGIPFYAALLTPAHWIAEIIYFPLETELLKYARSIGCKTISGGGMVVYQAAKAFELFTGIKPDAERMMKRFWEGIPK